MNFSQPHVAAMINIGCGPIVALVLSLVAAGVAYWFLTWFLNTFCKTFIKEPIFFWIGQVIMIACVGYAVLVAILIVFGWTFFGINVTPVCGG